MPSFIILISLLSVLFGNPSTNSKLQQDDPMARCLEKTSFEWGSTCNSCYNSTKSYRVNLKNVCKEKIDVKVAVQERTNRWRTFNLNNMAPGDSISSYACEGTGKYIFWTRQAGDKNIVFPTEEEIEKEYNPGK